MAIRLINSGYLGTKFAIQFSENEGMGGGGSEALWIFSENSSD